VSVGKCKGLRLWLEIREEIEEKIGVLFKVVIIVVLLKKVSKEGKGMVWLYELKEGIGEVNVSCWLF